MINWILNTVLDMFIIMIGSFGVAFLFFIMFKTITFVIFNLFLAIEKIVDFLLFVFEIVCDTFESFYYYFSPIKSARKEVNKVILDDNSFTKQKLYGRKKQ